MPPRAGESGQATAEYAGLIILVALAAVALGAINPGLELAETIQSAFCRAVGGECGSLPVAPTERELLDQAIEADLAAFLAMKASEAHDPRMDYSDDGCSAPVLGSTGSAYDFTEACERHDFGYRNAKRLGLFDEYKDRIDAVFREDMRESCEAVPALVRRRCLVMADLYYAGVRAGGGQCDLPGPVGRVPGPCAPEHG